jgi:hypothetical protein
MPLLLVDYAISRDYSFAIGGYRFGFEDAEHTFSGEVTLFHAGPLGEFYSVPFSAAQGCAITALLLATALVAVAWVGFRHRRATWARHTHT